MLYNHDSMTGALIDGVVISVCLVALIYILGHIGVNT